MDKEDSQRYPSCDRQPRQNAENAEDMTNLSAYLAEMLPQETVVMKLIQWISKNIFGKHSVPTEKEIEAILRFFVDVFAKIGGCDTTEGSIFAITRQFLCDFVLTNQLCYKRFPHEYLEQECQRFVPKCPQMRLLGSIFDGLGILCVCHKEQKTRIELSDIDVMGVFTAFPATVTYHRDSKATAEAALLVDSQGCHPGYVKLRIQGKHPIIEKPDSLQYEQGDEYLSHQALYHQVHKLSNMEDLEQFDIHIHGPALAIIGPQFFSISGNLVNRDLVFSLPLNTWPHEADEWFLRKRPSGWPNMEQIKAVKELECHVVPVANPGDRECRTEWRISFALAERHLVLSLNQVQRHVYRIIKLIHKHRLEESGMLSSYHLKTTLLWLCEHIPQDRWTDGEMGQRFYDFLDFLVDFLHKKLIPNYFIRENNMIDHIEEQLVNSNIDILRDIRHNPQSILAEIQEKYDLHFDPLSYLLPKMPIRGFHLLPQIWQLKAAADSNKISVTDIFSFLEMIGELLGACSLLNSDIVMGAIREAEDAMSDDEVRMLAEIRTLIKNLKENILKVGPEALSEDSIPSIDNGREFLEEIKKSVDDELGSVCNEKERALVFLARLFCKITGT